MLSIVRLWVELGSWQETIWEQCGLVDSPVIRWVGSVGVGWKGAAASFHCAGAAGAFGAKKVFVSNAGADETRGCVGPAADVPASDLRSRSHYVLWALTESIERANLQKTHDLSFDVTLSTPVKDVKRLAAPVTAGTP